MAQSSLDNYARSLNPIPTKRKAPTKKKSTTSKNKKAPASKVHVKAYSRSFPKKR